MPTNLNQQKLRWSKMQRMGLVLAVIFLSLLWGGGMLGPVHGADAIPDLTTEGQDRNPLIGVATRVTDSEIVVDDEEYRLAPQVELKTQGGRSLTRSQLVLPTQVRLQFRGERVVVIVQGEWPQ